MKNLRGRNRKIAVGENDIREFLKLSSEASIALFDAEYIHEVPSLESLFSAFLPMKIWLAKKLANALQEKIEPSTISSVHVEIVTYGGYIRVSFDQLVSKEGNDFKQPWKVSFIDKTQLPIIMKLTERFPPPKGQEFNTEMLEAVLRKL